MKTKSNEDPRERARRGRGRRQDKVEWVEEEERNNEKEAKGGGGRKR